MKRIRWKKLKKLVFDHPYFEYKPHLISEEEADRILSEGYPSVDEFLEIVKRRVEQNDYDTEFVLPEPERKARMPRNKLVARLAIGIAAVLLLSAFLAFTEPGNAFARAVRNFVVRIFDGDLIAQGTELPTNLPPIDYENMPDSFASLEDAARTIGRPIADLSKSNSSIVSIRVYVIDNSLMNLSTTYKASSDESILVAQWFPSENSSWGFGSSAGDGDVIFKELPNGIHLYAGYMDDGTSFVEAIGDGVYLSIASVELEREVLLNYASDLKLVEPNA